MNAAAPVPYLSPWATEEIQALRDTVRRFFEREFVPKYERWLAQGYVDPEAWRAAGAAGLLCVGIPEEFGGGDGTFAHEAVVIEELERCGIGVNFANTVHSAILAPYILHCGTEAQKRDWLPQLASGERIGAIAMTEPGGGSDLQAVKTTARLEGDTYVLRGSKTFISNGQIAGLFLVVAQTSPGSGAKGISLFLVDGESSGLRRGRRLEKIGLHAQDTSEIFFDDVRVPADHLLGLQPGQGFYQLMQQLPQERLGIAVAAVAAMERAFELTLDYTRQRRAFGRAIGEFQTVAFTLAELKTEAAVARTFVDSCIVRHLRGELDTATASMAKWWTTERQCHLIDACLQLHGGYGYMTEYPIARMYVDARVQKIYGGTNEIMKILIARAL